MAIQAIVRQADLETIWLFPSEMSTTATQQAMQQQVVTRSSAEVDEDDIPIEEIEYLDDQYVEEILYGSAQLR